MPNIPFSRLLPVFALSFGACFSMIQPVQAQGFAGPYLAARQAEISTDFAANVEYGTRALARDPDNMGLMEGLIVAQIGMGQIDNAVPVARRLIGLEADNQIAGLVMVTSLIKAEDWTGVLEMLEGGTSIGGLFDRVIKGWALVGAGQVEDGIDIFDAIITEGDSGQFAAYHRALALAYSGDYEAAAEVFSGSAGDTLQLDRAGLIAYAQILSQLERNPAAVDLVEQGFPSGGDAEIQTLHDELAAGKPIAFTMIRSPRDGLADMFTAVARSLARDLEPHVVLLYARTGEYLAPDQYEATLLSATLLEMLERYDLAVESYGRIGPDHRLYASAAQSRAEALRRWDKPDQAIAALEELAQAFPEDAAVLNTLGDTLRFNDNCEAAIGSYDRAVALFDNPNERQWSLFFSRGICHEALGNWPNAEADFRKALELNPEQPLVLNYLGYSYVEKRENLDEALDMIERAVAARSTDGFITDSLGWVYYRLGRYEEAVAVMERAVELTPVDPVINDHLGDVYWAVGRRNEAEFQWHRAFSFITDDTDLEEANPDRMLRKLEVGLDKVLEEEGADPLIRSDDDG